MAVIERFAPTSLPILLTGPTGTGKDLFARHVHAPPAQSVVRRSRLRRAAGRPRRTGPPTAPG
ncbi:MAG: sigma 54-interacting transcriptional regulator [Gemmatimonadales bacterium]